LASKLDMSTVNVGTAGWSIPKLYATEPPSNGTHLERYSRILSCTEINSSFYRPHRVATWAKWAESTPDGFRFSVKAPQAITHQAYLACTSAQLKIFLVGATTLAQKLGPILFQLPPKSAFNYIVAEAFLAMLRDQYKGPVVFEPRHPTWFTTAANHLLRRFHVARVVADPALLTEAAVAGGWQNLIYCRLHGSPRMYYSAYPNTYLQSLAAGIARQKTDVWCIFDNTAAGAAFGDAQTLKGLLTAYSSPSDSAKPA
jgi:uncharacterized protein YecE (DUF72 family)